MLKLLQSPAQDLRQVLVFIWAKILSLDPSCQSDLIKENGHVYFVKFLEPSTEAIASDQRAMAAFVLAAIMAGYAEGQAACQQKNLGAICTSQFDDADPFLRRWAVLCLAKLWDSAADPAVRVKAVTYNAPRAIAVLLSDWSVPRCAHLIQEPA